MNINEFRILLIDDDEDDYIQIRDIFSDIQRSKYHITWKSSYEDGLEALQKEPFDACLIDYRLGAQTGLDLLNETHKLGLTCPMILLTSHGDFDLDLQAMQVGAADYLVKDKLTAPLLERSIRYSIKHAFDVEEIKESKAQIMQQDRLASLGLLASSLAHEIGTPLGVIRSRAELAVKKAAGNEPLKKDMETVISQIDKIAKLVNSLLHLARNRQSDIATAVDLNQVVQDALNLVQHELSRKDITFELSLEDHLTVKAESGPLGQVLLNLMVNAVHAIEQAKNTGRKSQHGIKLSAKRQNSHVHIEITDTGCGIPQENIPQLFKPFFTTKDIGQGTGLGLATSYKIVQSWGGSINAASHGDRGATFTVKLLKA